MKIASVVGVRPQLIKLAPISHALKEKHTEIIIHTGQHYDFKMSEIFLYELGIPNPHYNLGAGSGLHGEQTGRMLIDVEQVLLKENPDMVLVFGDTNTTLAGALAASKLKIPIGHVEAGLRSFNQNMPEEINRVIVDHISKYLFCPTKKAFHNLTAEGITKNAHVTGDVMLDVVNFFHEKLDFTTDILTKLHVTAGNYLLATLHRASNTDDIENLNSLLETLSKLDEIVIFPVHPRTQKRIKDANLLAGTNIHMLNPVGYFEMLTLEKNARMILTDSGGVQKEAFFLGVPCITLRLETEWTELVEGGWNCVVGIDEASIIDLVRNWRPKKKFNNTKNIFGNGQAAMKIVNILESAGI